MPPFPFCPVFALPRNLPLLVMIPSSYRNSLYYPAPRLVDIVLHRDDVGCFRLRFPLLLGLCVLVDIVELTASKGSIVTLVSSG